MYTNYHNAENKTPATHSVGLSGVDALLSSWYNFMILDPEEVWARLQTHVLSICLELLSHPRIPQQCSDPPEMGNSQACSFSELTKASVADTHPVIPSGKGRTGVQGALHLAHWAGRLYSDPRRRLWNGFSVAAVAGWEGPRPFSWPLLWRC